MKKILKALACLGLFILGVLSGLVLLLISIFIWPQMIVNKSVLQKATPYAQKFSVHWEAADARAWSTSFSRKHFLFSFQNFCAEFSEGTKRVCFEEGSFEAEIGWHGWKPFIAEAGPARVVGGDVFVQLIDSPAQNGKKKEFPKIEIPSFLKETRFRSIEVQRTAFEIDTGSREIIGAASFYADETDASAGRGWYAEALAEGSLGPSESFDVIAEIDHGEAVSYRFEGVYAKEKLRANIETQGDWKDKVVSGHLKADVSGIVPQVHRVTTRDCTYDYRQVAPSSPASSNMGRFSLNCPVRVDLSPLELPSATFTRLVRVPYNLDFIVKTGFESSFFPSLDEKIKGSLQIALIPVSQDLLSAQGSTLTRFEGVPSEFPKDWNIFTDLDAQISLDHFAKLVRALERTAYAIPAPLHILDGNVTIGVKGRADIARSRGTLPIVFTTKLQSSDQSFFTEGKGELSYAVQNHAFDSSLEWNLDLPSLKITLPTLGYSSLPALVPDPRLKDESETPKPEKRQSHFDFKLRVKTSTNPAYLVSNFADQSIPITLDLLVDNGKLSGSVEVKPTDLHFFRKNAHLLGLKITLKDPKDLSEISGRARVIYAEYKIDVYVLGTLAKPRVVFESSPPLSEEQLVAALLYGQSYGDLTETQRSSVSDTSAVLAQQSIALGSLLLLASTPIESVSYNPATGAFAAKVRLSEGTLLNVATQENLQQVGIRKSLGGNWALSTYLENDQENEKQVGVSYFEWIKRY